MDGGTAQTHAMSSETVAPTYTTKRDESAPATSDGLSPQQPDPMGKASNEWTSSRSRSRRGTPPPMPRRGSHSDDALASMGAELLSRPRTPAQVLASRAQAAAPSGPPKAISTVHDEATGRSPQQLLTARDAGETDTLTHDDLIMKTPEPESGGDGRGAPSDKDEVAISMVETESAEVDPHDEDKDKDLHHTDEPERRTSVQLSAISDQSAADSEGADGYSYSRYRRDERIDTSTVDEESICHDEDEDEDEDDEHDHDHDHDDDEHDQRGHGDGDSVGTSDEYVNVDDDENEDDQQRQTDGDDDEDSYTPDNTPPPSPPRVMQPPPPLATDWIKYTAESGHEYYYNARTQVSQWTRPASFALLSPTASGSGAVSAAISYEPNHENQNQAPDEMEYHGRQQLLPQQIPVSVHVRSANDALPPPAPVTVPGSPYLDSLFLAVTKNDETAQLQEILRYEIDVNAVNRSGLAPLHVAVQHGNARGVAMLLEYGAIADGPSATDSIFNTAPLTESPLMMACRTNHASLVRVLVRYGASMYTRDSDGNTVLHIAIRCWSEEVLACLLEMDSVAAIINLRNADDETPLHLAARHGNANAVRVLLASGASVDVEDSQGRTPLVVSIMENRVDCAQLLQGAGHHDRSYYSYSTTDGAAATSSLDTGPVMYDAPPQLPDNGTIGSDTSRANELQALQLYLTQLLEHAASDDMLATTVYQYMEATQRELASYEEARRREETLLLQIDMLTNMQSTSSGELAQEREENEHLRHQLDARDSELSTLQAAYESLSSRSSMLESIARSSQDKLRRERVEHARQEEYWNQTIDNSLRENATLLQSVHSLQEGWAQQTPLDGQGQATDEEDPSHDVYQDTFDSVPSEYDQYSTYDNSHSENVSNGFDPNYESGGYEPAVSYGQDPSYHRSEPPVTPPPAQVLPLPHEPDVPMPPARVDAVWNRFFENMSRAAEATPPNQGRRPTTLSPRNNNNASLVAQHALAPPSAVFDAIRKDKRDRLYQLLLSGLSPNVRDLGEKGTPLHLASELGDLDAIMLLCEFGANVEIRDENGNTPLLAACSQGHYECTKFLLQSAANQETINANKDTALHLAAWDGSFECVEILLEYEVNVLARNALGLTALANLKTRSPLRHRFDDLVVDHPMAKTLRLLERAEAAETDEQEAVTDRATTSSTAVAPKSLISSKDQPAATKNTSWGRWLIGSVFGTAREEPLPDHEDGSSEEDADESTSVFEEAESSPTNLHSYHHHFDHLRPPPDIEAELRRTPLSPTLGTLPPPPPEVLAAIEKRKLGGGGATLLSPASSATRFASPASISGSKKTLQTTPTNVRTRYVDTFNSP